MVLLQIGLEYAKMLRRIWKKGIDLQKRIAILGSTGSIGCQTLEVLDETPGLVACGLAGRDNWQLLAQQAKRYRPAFVALGENGCADKLASALPEGTELLTGPGAMCELIRRARPDVALTAVMGAAGLEPTLAAIEVGCTLAIANKETLVCAGGLIMPAAKQAGLAVLPVDSEHSGIFQCMLAGRSSEVQRVILTSSGGSLRDLSDAQAHDATPAEALAHPTWQMGQKITIDSATLMNKTLEIIEAHWLFGLGAEQIEVVVHPQSIVHALVEFCDGSVIAQLARPDMKGPIAYALGYPDRPERDVEPLDLSSISNLDFRPLSERGNRAVNLAYEVIRLGGASGAVLNAANEAAVEAFLAGDIKFGQIVPLVEKTLHQWVNEQKTATMKPDNSNITLKQIRQADAWAREKIRELGRLGNRQ